MRLIIDKDRNHDPEVLVTLTEVSGGVDVEVAEIVSDTPMCRGGPYPPVKLLRIGNDGKVHFFEYPSSRSLPKGFQINSLVRRAYVGSTIEL
jgi:hypothetical protein